MRPCSPTLLTVEDNGFDVSVDSLDLLIIKDLLTFQVTGSPNNEEGVGRNMVDLERVYSNC